jgi:predicted kinase
VGRLLVVIFGLMGTGKTTLARELAAARGWPVLHSDVVRKELAGLPPTAPVREEFGQGIYAPDFSARTYAEMRRRAREHLQAGASGVIVDASFKSARERHLVQELAREQGARAVFVLCECPREVVRERLLRRAAEAASISDGRLEILELQEQDFEPVTGAEEPLVRVDTGGEVAGALAQVEEFLRQQGASWEGREA